jgi:CDGSH-type Zn-finger protein
MARQVKLKANGPLKVGDKWVCRCGLSKKWNEEDPQPFCDGSHNKIDKVKEETFVCEYDENMVAKTI